MTKLLSVIVLSLAMAITFTACKKQGATGTAKEAAVSIDTSSAQAMFRTASPEVRDQFERVVSVIRSGNYAGALEMLKSIGANARLAPEQQQAIRDLMVKVQEAMAGGASKALDDAKKSLPK